MKNHWKVIWVDKKKRKRLTRFKEVKDAVVYRDRLKADNLEVYVVSASQSYPIPRFTKSGKRHPKADRPSSRHWWCPYCIEWRMFEHSAIRYKTDGFWLTGPEQWRCPICTISEAEYWVRKYNGMLDHVDPKKLFKGVVSLQNVE
jgi:rubrerythrin